jgi:hypothetical protein
VRHFDVLRDKMSRQDFCFYPNGMDQPGLNPSHISFFGFVGFGTENALQE